MKSKLRMLFFTFAMLLTCISFSSVKVQAEECDGHFIVTDEYKKCDLTYHEHKYVCDLCGNEVKWEKEEHEWQSTVTKKASICSKGQKEYYCKICGQKKTVSFSWKYNNYQNNIRAYQSRVDGYSKNGEVDAYCNYDILSHSMVYRTSRYINVKLHRAVKGAVLKVQIGDKTYSKKLTDNSKKIKVSIKNPAYGKKIKINLYYKGKLIGKDRCCYGVEGGPDDDYVYYSKNISEGMTIKQAKYASNWANPDEKKTDSEGWTYWEYGNGNTIIFYKGKVNYYSIADVFTES